MSAAARPKPAKRVLVTQACDFCRTSKVKCKRDAREGASCNACEQAAVPCLFSKVQKKRGPKKGHLEALETSLVNLKRAVALLIQENPSVELTVENCIGPEDLQRIKSADFGKRPRASSSATQQLGSPNFISPESTSAPLPVPEERRSGIDALLNAVLPVQAPLPDILNIPPTAPRSRGQLAIGPDGLVTIHGSSSGLELLAPAATGHQGSWLPLPPQSVPKLSSDSLGERQRSLVKRTLELMPDTEESSELTLDRSRQLHEIYWALVHPVLPVIYRDTYDAAIHVWFGSVIHARDKTNPSYGSLIEKSSHVVLYFAILACAEAYHQDDDTNGGSVSRAGDLLEQAVAVMDTLQTDMSSRLMRCQATLLIAYAYLGRGDVNQAWMLTGKAIRLAQDLNLFRDLEAYPEALNASGSFSHGQLEVRKRCWYSCIYLDNLISALRGHPTTIRQADWDVTLPSIDEPDELTQWRPIRPPPAEVPGVIPYEPTKSRILSCFNAAATLAAITNRVLLHLYPVRRMSPLSEREVMRNRLDNELMLFYSSLPASLSLSGPNAPAPHILSLHAQYYTSQILLNRSFVEDSTQGASVAMQICTRSATAIVQIMRLYNVAFGLANSANAALPFFCFVAATVSACNLTRDPSLTTHAQQELQEAFDLLEEIVPTWPAANNARVLLADFIRRATSGGDDGQMEFYEDDEEEGEDEIDEIEERSGGRGGGGSEASGSASGSGGMMNGVKTGLMANGLVGGGLGLNEGGLLGTETMASTPAFNNFWFA